MLRSEGFKLESGGYYTYCGRYDGELDKDSLDAEFKRLMEKITDFDKSAFCVRRGGFLEQDSYRRKTSLQNHTFSFEKPQRNRYTYAKIK